MKVQISEVWNAERRSKTLAEIEVPAYDNPRNAAYAWIRAHRPDLTLAVTLDDHGFHAVEVK